MRSYREKSARRTSVARLISIVAAMSMALASTTVSAYPGGTPDFQTEYLAPQP